MGEAQIMDDVRVVRDVWELVGELTDDEAALVRTLTPVELTEEVMVEHLFDLVNVLATIRDDEAMADYVYAIAPGWDGSIETLLLGGRVTTAFNRHELESCGAELFAPARCAPVRPARTLRVPVPVG